MKQLSSAVPYGIVFAVLAAMFSCNDAPVSGIVQSKIILPDTSETPYRLKMHFFILYPGDTALLSGTSRRTTIKNGSVVSDVKDSIFFRTITGTLEYMTIDGKQRIVFPQKFQTADSHDKLEQSSIVRYFEKNDTAIVQLAYNEGNGCTYVEPAQQKVLPQTVDAGSFKMIMPNNTWTASPLIKNPVQCSDGSVWMSGQAVAYKSIAIPEGELYKVNGISYSKGVGVRYYFTIGGEGVENGKQTRFSGYIIRTYNYIAMRGLVEMFGTSCIQRHSTDGGIETTNETLYLCRLTEAKEYKDYLKPIPPPPQP